MVRVMRKNYGYHTSRSCLWRSVLSYVICWIFVIGPIYFGRIGDRVNNFKQIVLMV